MADDDQPRAPEAPPEKPVTDVHAKISDVANRWLEQRFGLKVGDGGMQLPDSESIKDFGLRTEQFLRSFFKGFLDKAPNESGAEAQGDGPSATEVATRVALKTAGTVQNAFNDYLRDHAVEPAHAETTPVVPVVIDGRFIARHGIPLLGHLIQALGGAFAADTKAEHIPEPTPKVDVKIDLFTSLLGKMMSKDEPKEPT